MDGKSIHLSTPDAGKEADYDGVDVTGCLVMVDINQRDEWWINYPVYQAHLKGAAAVIAVQDNGYGEIDSEALNAQDIAGPKGRPGVFHVEKGCGDPESGIKGETADHGTV